MLTLVGTRRLARERMGGIHGIAQNRAAFDIPGHGIQSVSRSVKAGADIRDAETINDIIKSTYVPAMQNVELEGQRIEPPKQLSWYVQASGLWLISRYPGGLAWQVDAPKRVVRKSPPFKTFQRFLVGETEVVGLFREDVGFQLIV
jgi:hypothetical protein